MMNQYIVYILLLLFSSCQSKEEVKPDMVVPVAEPMVVVQPEPIWPERFGRTGIRERLQSKIKGKEDLYVHVFVPLCDNEHQGIVPVNKTLGDGFNPKSNLYWGALYGVKTHLKKHAGWKLVDTKGNPNNDGIVLERIVFEKSGNGQKVYLVADAYRGDKMKDCLLDYMNSLAGISKGNIDVDSTRIGVNGNADLLVFNGHNGLMDVEIPIIENKDHVKRDAVAIACASHGFFTPMSAYNGGYPLVMTTNLLAPEAYVLEAVVSEWAKGSDGVLVADAAGRAYNEYQKCGYRGARRLFKSGW